MTEDLNLAAPYPRAYTYTVAGAVYTYVGGFGGNIVLGLFLKTLSDSWTWALVGTLAGMLFVLCLALLIAAPTVLIGYGEALTKAGRIVPVEEPQPL